MIYFDNAATTALSSAALQTMLPFFDQVYGNPSSAHAMGREARTALISAREEIASCLNCLPCEIIFTSGGSEADTQAIRTAARIGQKKGKKHIISIPSEHHAVLHTLDSLKKEGFEIQLLPLDSMGRIQPCQVKDALRPDTALVTVMYANNEIGTLYPIREIGEICRSEGVLFHTDAVQAAGHLAIDIEKDCVDFLSLSAHKFHGPKGTGLLYARKGLPMTHLIEGGSQESGRRSGTENVPGIMGMAAALKEACLHQEEQMAYVSRLRDTLIDEVLKIPHCVLNGPRKERLPGNISICIEGVTGDALLSALDELGICCSAGSACTSASADPSHVLRAIGRPAQLARGALRISLCEKNTSAEVDYFLSHFPGIIKNLRDHSPVWKMKTEGSLDFLT